MWEGKGPRVGKAVLKNKAGKFKLLDIKIYYQSMLMETVWSMCEDAWAGEWSDEAAQSAQTHLYVARPVVRWCCVER